MFVYCAGHGVADQQQYFVLNHAEHNLVSVEQKLRSLCKNSEGNFCVFAVYDICRSELNKFKGLRRGEEENDVAAGPQINYVAISGTDPRGTVPAASKLAVLLFKEAELYAANDKFSRIHVPMFCMDFSGENGLVEKTMMGKSYYINWKCDESSKAALQAPEESKEPIEESKQYMPKTKATGPWKPSLQRPIMFGQGSDPLVGKFPMLEDLCKLQSPPKLTQIKYKCEGDDSQIYAIQLVFDNGYKTPLYELDYSSRDDFRPGKLKTLKIDPKQKVATIALKEMIGYMGDGGDETCFWGIRLENEKCEEIACFENDSSDFRDGICRWVYKDVPEGQVIVGVQVGERKGLPLISRIGFRMATLDSDEKAVAKPFIPTEITDHIEFGDKLYICNETWDNLKAFKKPSKLIGIKVQHDDEGNPLHGIQLLF